MMYFILPWLFFLCAILLLQFAIAGISISLEVFGLHRGMVFDIRDYIIPAAVVLGWLQVLGAVAIGVFYAYDARKTRMEKLRAAQERELDRFLESLRDM